ncbi:hypothetical protein [Metamycoplasma gateae]|uniref:DUF31 domain-containing protein n=1 Tax=Metamycoplasma gateae TaxID=35769 RepID=A0ABZ2AHQ5_9BACT|nr:hypothetical protein V2E26_01585 [Metamycoplasma gateae]
MPSTKNEKLKGTHWRFFSPVSIDELIKGNFSGYNGYYDNNLTAGFKFNELHSYTNKIYELTKKKEEFYNEFISKHINYDKSIQYFFRKKLFHANSIDEVLQLKQEFLETIELKKDVIENYFKPLIIRREGLSEKAIELLQTNRLQQNLFQGLNFVFSKDSINEYKDLLVFLKENKDDAIWDENIKIYKEELPEQNFLNNIFSNTYDEYNKQLIEKSGNEEYSSYYENDQLYYNYYLKYDKMHVGWLSTSGPDKVILLNNLIDLGDKEVIIQNPTAIYKPFINPLFKDYEFKNGEINEFNSTITLFKLLIHQFKPQYQIDNRKYMNNPENGNWRKIEYSNSFISQIWLNFTHEKVLDMNEWFKNSHYSLENNDSSWWDETLEEMSKDTSIKNIHKRHEYLTNWVNKTEFSVENLSSDDIFMEFFISLYSIGEEYGKSDYNKDNLPYKYRDGLPLKNSFPKPYNHYGKQIYRFAKYIDHKINIEENQTVDYIEEW